VLESGQDVSRQSIPGGSERSLAGFDFRSRASSRRSARNDDDDDHDNSADDDLADKHYSSPDEHVERRQFGWQVGRFIVRYDERGNDYNGEARRA
jgi:hypothetical protein